MIMPMSFDKIWKKYEANVFKTTIKVQFYIYKKVQM